MNDEELLRECQKFLEHICVTVGDVITEYHWREAAALSSMIDDAKGRNDKQPEERKSTESSSTSLGDEW